VSCLRGHQQWASLALGSGCRVGEVVLGVIVLFLFGGALISGLIPHTGISWEAHLFGGIGGVLAAAELSHPARGQRSATDAPNPLATAR